MSITQTVREDMKTALKAKDEVRLTTLRGLLSAFTNELVSLKRKPTDALSEPEALAVIKRAVKQRKDSIEQFEKGGRADLVEREQAELAIVESYVPLGMSEADIRTIAEAKKIELNATDKAKAGILVGAVMKACGGNADGAVVKKVVEALF